MDPEPFLDLQGFLALWDGPPLTPRQRAAVSLLVQVASKWIYRNGPQRASLPQSDPTAQWVVYDVVSTAIRYQKYSKLSNFNKTTAHRMDGGSFSDPMSALEFTDTHKQLLEIPLEALPMSSCRPSDFHADDAHQGWPTAWSDSFRNQGWDWWAVSND